MIKYRHDLFYFTKQLIVLASYSPSSIVSYIWYIDLSKRLASLNFKVIIINF